MAQKLTSSALVLTLFIQTDQINVNPLKPVCSILVRLSGCVQFLCDEIHFDQKFSISVCHSA